MTKPGALLLAMLSACSSGRPAPVSDERVTPAPTPAVQDPPSPAPEEAMPLPPPVIVPLPDTRAGALAQAWLSAMNGGDAAALRAFFERRLAEKARALQPLDAWSVPFAAMAEQGGGLDVVGLDPSDDPGAVSFLVRGRGADRYAQVLFVVDADGALLDAYVQAKPHPAAVDEGKLAPVAVSEEEVVRAITRRVEQLGASDRFSGAVLVVKGNRELVRLAQGHAEKAFAAPNRVDTKFNLGSMNKMFTAVAVAQLVERGKLSFDQTVLEVLPEYPGRAFAERAKLHHLLTHTSGIGGTIFAPQIFEHRDRFKRPADYLPVFASVPPEFSPGERFAYANPGFMVLGAIVERVSGERYDDVVQREVFARAGMSDTAAHAWDEVTPNLAVGYTREETDAFAMRPRRTNVSGLPYAGTPAGGGYSTAPDLRAFAEALRGHRLLGAAMTETVTTGKVQAEGLGPSFQYAYGFLTRRVNGKEIRGHHGGAPGINAQLDIFWDGSYIVAVLGNYDFPNASELAGEISEFLAAQAP